GDRGRAGHDILDVGARERPSVPAGESSQIGRPHPQRRRHRSVAASIGPVARGAGAQVCALPFRDLLLAAGHDLLLHPAALAFAGGEQEREETRDAGDPTHAVGALAQPTTACNRCRLAAAMDGRYKSGMERRTFGRTGVAVPMIGQGTWMLERTDRRSALAALRRGLDLGLLHVDTAELYGSGRVEETVGEAIASRSGWVDQVEDVLSHTS